MGLRLQPPRGGLRPNRPYHVELAKEGGWSDVEELKDEGEGRFGAPERYAQFLGLECGSLLTAKMSGRSWRSELACWKEGWQEKDGFVGGKVNALAARCV
jgi:hypothetical protein